MTRAEVERLAQERLASEEAAAPRRTAYTLGMGWRRFWRHPSPWLMSAMLVGALTARLTLGGWRWSELIAPVAFVALFPVIEWVVHVCVLHWRPRRVAGITVDSQLARMHREHHADPRDLPLVFIPWQTLLFVIAGFLAVALLVFPRTEAGLTFVAGVAVMGLVYEWTHYLIHSDYRPRSRAYKAIWRNHRLHHYRNENYWFGVTTSGTSDRLFGTYPDPRSVPTSATAKNLHGG